MEERLERVLPNNLDAEKSVLGSMLLEKEAMELVLEQLRTEDFYSVAHQHIFEAMVNIRAAGQAVDPVTLSEELERRGFLDTIGGAVYLTELMAFVPTAANVSYYAKIVEERSVQRSLVHAGNDMIRDGMNDDKDVEESLNLAEKRIYDISMRKTEDSIAPIKDIVPDALNEIGDLMARQGKLTGVATGFRDLDRMTNGLQKSD